MTPKERQLRAALGGLSTSARGTGTTEAARRAYALSDHADCLACGRPGPLPEDLGGAERARRLAARQKLHMASIAYRSVRSRGKRKAAT